LIIVSTFLARSPTSYGKGLEVFSRETQSPKRRADYELGVEGMSLQQDSLLDSKSSDSEFHMTEQPVSNTHTLTIKKPVPVRSFTDITKHPLSYSQKSDILPSLVENIQRQSSTREQREGAQLD
jgi:hypothetical protein